MPVLFPTGLQLRFTAEFTTCEFTYSTYIKGSFFVLFVTPKPSFVQLQVHISLTDHCCGAVRPPLPSLCPIFHHFMPCTALSSMLCLHPGTLLGVNISITYRSTNCYFYLYKSAPYKEKQN